MATTQNNLVAVFESYATAQKAQEELISSGFDRNEIQIAGGTSAATHQHEGGISGFFHNLFGAGEDHEHKGKYENAVQGGNAVLTIVGDESELDEAAEILDRYSPIDLDQSSGTTGVVGSTASKTTTEGNTIPVVQEDLLVGKRSFQSGGVRVYSRVVEEPVEEKVTLREERVSVNRVAVDRPATEADFHSGNEVIEMVETAEEAVVGKRARVVEEVTIGKDTSHRTETVRDTVRHTDVQVERIPADAMTDFRNDYQSRYSTQPGADFDTYEPDYEYGYGIAGEQNYKGKNWEDIQDTVKTDYMRTNPKSTWERAGGAVRYGWERATGKR